MSRSESERDGRAARKCVMALSVAITLALPCARVAAQAAQVVSPGWHLTGLVTRIHPGDGAGYFFFSAATPLGIAGCDNSYGYAFSDVGSVASRNLALLMMAYSTGKPISVHLTGSCMANGGGRPMVDTVEVTEVGYY